MKPEEGSFTAEDPSFSFPVIIIGSGPAGLAARLGVRENGADAVILERMDRPSLKLLASGGTKCNFSNMLPSEDFMRKFGRNGLFMRNALSLTSREWIVDFLEKHGVKTVLADDFYCFPAEGGAKAVRDAFSEGFAPVRVFSEVQEILCRGGRAVGVRLSDGKEISAKAVILAAGGSAWQGLGSSAGLRLAEKCGHTIVKPLPAVAPLVIKEKWVSGLAGVSMEKAVLTLRNPKGREVLTTCGNLLFTHEGLSGFAALDISAEAALLCDKNGSASLFLKLFPERTKEKIRELLESFRRDHGGKLVRILLAGEGLTHSLADAVCGLAGCMETYACQLSGEQRDTLAGLLDGIPLTVVSVGPMSKAMAMRGGVSLKEIDPSTMESRLIGNLYFAGEIVDLTGPCGGYNIQWAVSSGRLAGKSAAEKIKMRDER